MTAYGTYTFESRQNDPLEGYVYFDIIGTPIIQNQVMVVNPSQTKNLFQSTLGALTAETTLQRLGYRNVKIRAGDGSRGWTEYAPFDAILVSAATAEMPQALFEQLREGGRMMVPVGPSSCQELQLVRKVRGQPVVEIFEGCRFVPLVGGTVGSG